MEARWTCLALAIAVAKSRRGYRGFSKVRRQ